ncbi:MAG: radical SAM protein [Roseburia sp.]|nr:radical SAM protein [Roseburia sp.]
MKECRLCPRDCGVNRSAGAQSVLREENGRGTSVCGETDRVRLARAALHMWEEPCITGLGGSGTVFFSGCSLHCVFCQNASIANGNVGKEVSMERLAEIFLELQERGAENINLVTGDHFVPMIIRSLKRAKDQGIYLPVVYNTSSYVKVDTLKSLEGLVDIYLPDFKYYDGELAYRYARARDYPSTAKEAIREMVRQQGKPEFLGRDGKILGSEDYNAIEEPEGIVMRRGTIVRHLILPGGLEDSKKILSYLLDSYGTKIYISIMNQYTPVKNFSDLPELNRRVTEEEYETLLQFAIDRGIENGFLQEGDTAEKSFIPSFNYEGV